MPQYSTGTVSINHNDTTVELVGGSTSTMSAGDMFVPADGQFVPYFIAGITDDDTFELSAPYQGVASANLTGAGYVVHTDYLAGGIPIMAPGDLEYPAIFNRAMQILVAGGGGGVSTFIALIDTLNSYVNQAGKLLRINAGETAVEAIDHRFLGDTIAEVAPSTLSGRLVHYSMLNGSLSQASGRVSQWNDTSGNARHATQDSVGPRLAGLAGRPGYGLVFDSAATDDILMLATVPASQNAMFLFAVVRVDPVHPVSQNVFKTAHDGAVDTQTAGDIELAPASSGDTLNLRISTSAGAGQIVSLGSGLKTGETAIIGLAIDTGSVTGWVWPRGMPPRAISDTYSHGTGFDSDRMRLGKTSQLTAFTLHEVLLASTLPDDDEIQGLLLWAANRYFTSTLEQDVPSPRFKSSPSFEGNFLRYTRRPPVSSNGTTLTLPFGVTRTLSPTYEVTADLEWSGYTFRHSSNLTHDFTLRADAPENWEIEVSQDGDSSGQIDILFASGATNMNGFATTVSAGATLRIICKRNTTGSAAEYEAYSPSSIAIASQAEARAGTENTKMMTALRVDEYADANVRKLGPPTPCTPDVNGEFALTEANADANLVCLEAVLLVIDKTATTARTEWNVRSFSAGVQAQIEDLAGSMRRNAVAVTGGIVDLLSEGQEAAFSLVSNGSGTAPTIDASGVAGSESSPVGPVYMDGEQIYNFAERQYWLGASLSGAVTITVANGTIQMAGLSGNITSMSLEGGAKMPPDATINLILDLNSNSIAMPTGTWWTGASTPSVGTGIFDVLLTKLIDHLNATAVSDLVIGTPTGFDAQWTSSGSNLPAWSAGDQVWLYDNDDPENTGWWVVDTVNTSTSDYDMTKLGKVAPVAASSEAVNVAGFIYLARLAGTDVGAP